MQNDLGFKREGLNDYWIPEKLHDPSCGLQRTWFKKKGTWLADIKPAVRGLREVVLSIVFIFEFHSWTNLQ